MSRHPDQRPEIYQHSRLHVDSEAAEIQRLRNQGGPRTFPGASLISQAFTPQEEPGSTAFGVRRPACLERSGAVRQEEWAAFGESFTYLAI